MRRAWGIVALATLVVPAAAHAQKKPSNSMQTRSAEIYIGRLKGAGTDKERNDLLDKALEVLTEGMTKDPDNPKVWFLAGQVYARKGDAAGADSTFDKAEALYPDYRKETQQERLALWVQKYNQGVSAAQQQKNNEAIADFEAADQIYDGRAESALIMGSLLAQKGDLKGAEAAYRKALAITEGPAAQSVAPKDKPVWLEQEASSAHRLASLLEQTGRKDEALEIYRSLVQHQPANASAKADLATALSNAGNKDEAAKTYEQLFASGDLSDTQWFNAGVQMYGSSNYEMAARAFRKSIEKNPYARDALYNLGQALYAQAAALEDQRKAAPDAQKAALNAKIEPIYKELLDVAGKMRELDPNYRPAIMMMAQSQRSLSETATDAAAAKVWRDKVVATLQSAENVPFEISAVELQPSQGGAVVNGKLTNLKGTPGQNVTLEFTVLGEGGAAVATQTVTVALKEAETAVPFTFEVQTDKAILGWKYRVTS